MLGQKKERDSDSMSFDHDLVSFSQLPSKYEHAFISYAHVPYGKENNLALEQKGDLPRTGRCLANKQGSVTHGLGADMCFLSEGPGI